MLLDNRGHPAPNQEIVRRLKQINPALGLRFVDPGEHGGSHWCVTWDWPHDDQRWSRVRNQEIPPSDAWDILCRMPADSSPDEAYGYVVRTFKANQSKEEIAQLLLRAHLYNQGVEKSIEDEAMAEAYNMAEVRGHAIVGEALGNPVIKVGPGSRPAMNKAAEPKKRGRGRPPGSKNKPKTKAKS